MEKKYVDLATLGIGFCNPEIFEDKGYAKGWNSAIQILNDAPAADVVPVVRCEDCKYWKYVSWGKENRCTARGAAFQTNADDFCSCGQRRE